MKKKVLSLLLALCLVLTALPVTSLAAETEHGEKMINIVATREQETLNNTYYATPEDAAPTLREGMVNRRSTVQVGLVAKYWGEDSLRFYANKMLNIAMAHTGVSNEGDYLYFNTLYVELSAAVDPPEGEGGNALVDYYFDFTYLTNSAQESEIASLLEEFYNGWDIDDEDEYDKLLTVYNYLNNGVTYLGPITEDTLLADCTARAPLYDAAGTDYAIALLLYRMALDYGIDCRIVCGTVDGVERYWNIVEMNGKYYHTDAALDAETGKYEHFLQGSDSFADHILYEDYTTEEFTASYPISKEDFGHTFDQGVVTAEPTCTEDGIMTYTCTTCGYQETEAIPAVGHDYDQGTVTREPSCTEEGEVLYTCSVCGGTYTEKTDPTGHDYTSEVTKKSTCSEKGQVTYTCQVCAHTYTDELALLNHTYESAVTTEPTCDKEGVRTYTCTECSASYTEAIATVPHVFEDDVCTGCGAGAIYRISGASRYDTAYVAADVLKETLGLEKFNTIIVASGENFADALTGSYLAAVREAPILLYNDKVLEDNMAYITENLAEGGRVCILGGTSSVSGKLDEALKAEGIHVQRFAGSDRFETNLAILEAAGVGDKEILVCTAYNFADSLSASAAGLPILLVNNKTGKLTEGQKAFLEVQDGNDFTIIGGVNSVSEALEEVLSGYGNVERISGASREETSALFADKYFEAPEYALVAYSRNFPDGLCGGPLAYAMGAPLLLASKGGEDMAAAYIECAEIIKGYVLGGTSAIADASVRIIFNMKDNVQIMTK
ncbi:MAG: cell wall-binding repeat-containing protein [Oscillospiraceae bacterium]|nr:cell wall-binding repeat-containing protein [Oscillospiraceae bacterium]